MSTVSTAYPTINPALILPFRRAIQEVFQTVANVAVVPQPPRLKRGGEVCEFDICGIISFTGSVTGIAAVRFSEAAAAKLIEAFVGATMPRGSADFADAIGELTNQIVGTAKRQIDRAADISVPTVVIGHHFSIATNRKMPSVMIPCDSPLGALAAEVCLEAA